MGRSLLAFALFGFAVSTTITLDDMNKESVAESVEMAKDGLEHCQTDAHGGSFHHDRATNKGSASFTFKFDVSQDGCYSLEEYHPGNDIKCSQLLTTNAQLDIDWCIGKKSTLVFDQSKNGGMWNFVGIFPYFVGHPGSLKMSNPEGSVGQHLAVDAFRITRVGDKCTGELQHKLWREYLVKKSAVQGQDKETKKEGSTLAPTTAIAMKYGWKEGSLQLSLQGQVNEDLLANLKAQAATLETALKSHLNARSVAVQDIVPVDARRLSGCRRLQALGDSLHFNVHFKAEVPSSANVMEAAFSSELATAFAGAGAKFQLESVEFQWWPTKVPSGEPTDGENNAGMSPLPFVLAGIAALAMLAVSVTIAVLKCQNKQAAPANVQSDNAQDAVKELENGQNEKTEATKDDAAQKAVQQVDDNASTATPESDPAVKDLDVISVEVSSFQTE